VLVEFRPGRFVRLCGHRFVQRGFRERGLSSRRGGCEAHLTQRAGSGASPRRSGFQPLRPGESYLNNFLAFFRVNRQLILVRFRLACRFSLGFPLQRFQIRNPSLAQTLPRYKLSSISA